MEATVKFLYVAVCFCITLICAKKPVSQKDRLFLFLGMYSTLVSDFLLIILLNIRLGVFTFCFVHIAYIVRNGGIKRLTAYGFAAAAVFLAAYSVIGDLLLALSAAYAALFAANLYTACIAYKEHRLPKANRRLMLWGTVLFALCDINVFLFNLRFYVKNSIIIEIVSPAALLLAWVFYAPSQFVLAISGTNFKKEDV